MKCPRGRAAIGHVFALWCCPSYRVRITGWMEPGMRDYTGEWEPCAPPGFAIHDNRSTFTEADFHARYEWIPPEDQ